MKLLAAALTAALLAVSVLAVSLARRDTVPTCLGEDDVVIGTGDYSGGRWSGYRCATLTVETAPDGRAYPSTYPLGGAE